MGFEANQPNSIFWIYIYYSPTKTIALQIYQKINCSSVSPFQTHMHFYDTTHATIATRTLLPKTVFAPYLAEEPRTNLAIVDSTLSPEYEYPTTFQTCYILEKQMSTQRKDGSLIPYTPHHRT